EHFFPQDVVAGACGLAFGLDVLHDQFPGARVLIPEVWSVFPDQDAVVLEAVDGLEFQIVDLAGPLHQAKLAVAACLLLAVKRVAVLLHSDVAKLTALLRFDGWGWRWCRSHEDLAHGLVGVEPSGHELAD